MPSATITQTLANQTVVPNASNTVVNLNNDFNDPNITGTVVQFNTNLGAMNVGLFDTARPLTVANFLSYVNSGAYTDSFIHRSAGLTPPPTAFQGIVATTSGSGVTATGSWSALAGTGLVGSTYLSDTNSHKGSDSVVFSTTLPVAGLYNVLIRWVAGPSNSTSVPVSIVDATGTITGTINEASANAGQWVQLNPTGSYYGFAPGSGGTVTISNTNTTGTVNIDAVAFQLVTQSFVIQGGGFTLTTNATTTTPTDFHTIPTGPPVQNEAQLSSIPNDRGVIAMAKTSQPNSATDQFFFDVNNNTSLDDPTQASNTGGFTAFGDILNAGGFQVMDAIAGLPTHDFTTLNPAFDTVPLITYSGSGTPNQSNLVMINSVAVIPKMVYTVTSSNGALVKATVVNGSLTLQYTANKFGSSTITVNATSADGTTVSQAFNVNVAVPAPFAALFDSAYYLQKYPDVAASVQSGAIPSAVDHYYLYGQYEGRSPSPYWNEAYYLAQNPDVAASVKAGTLPSGFYHFALYGQKENRVFSPYFDEIYYLSVNPDVAAGVKAGTFDSGFEHWVENGQFEGRNFNPLYSESIYLADNPDVAAAVKAGTYESGFEHFILYGQSEGRTFSAYFSESFYLARNPDVAAAVQAGTFASGFEHFEMYGQYEGRTFNPYYSESFYLAQNPDVAASVHSGVWRSGIEHFVAFGQFEDRNFSEYFDEAFYLAEYPDVAASVRAGTVTSGFEHFMLYGMAEGRNAVALYNEQYYLANNPDVAAAVQQGTWASGFAHFAATGWQEDRLYSPYFDLDYYVGRYPSVLSAINNSPYHSALEFFVEVGQWEGQVAVPPPM